MLTIKTQHGAGEQKPFGCLDVIATHSKLSTVMAHWDS